jgi:predicted AAA+ superfamily ATPase
MERCLMDGGFPEVWAFDSRETKFEYLYDNQIKKVINEDLVLATELRKPELLKRFYIALLENPGSETTYSKIHEETNVSIEQIQKYFPLLEMTDLLSRIEKFRPSSLRVRRHGFKVYLVDLALRNAVLRVENIDEATLGLYAENLVYNALAKWKGRLGLDYYRERQNEIDFVLHAGNRQYVLFEVSYKNRIKASKTNFLRRFAKKVKITRPIVITKNRIDLGGAKTGEFRIPLMQFLSMLD